MDDQNDELTPLEHLTNPAGRLFLVFDSLRAQLRDLGDTEVRSILRKHYGMDGSDADPAYFSVIAELMQQPIQARTAIASLDGGPGLRKSVLLRPYAPVEQALPKAAIPGLHVSQFLSGVDDAVLQGLEYGSAALFERKLYRAVDAEAMQTIRDLATSILDEIAGAVNLPRDVRETLRVHAQRIVTAADSYRISGSDGLTDSLDGIVGAVVIGHRRAPGLMNHPFVRKIVQLAEIITAATTIGGAAVALGAGAGSLFEMLESTPTVVVDLPADVASDHPQHSA